MADTNGGIWKESSGKFTYSVGGSVVATVSNLKNGLYVKNDGIDGIEVDGNRIVLSRKVFKTGTLPSITSETYTLDVAEDCAPQVAATWTQGIRGYILEVGGKTDGYELDSDGKVAYVAAQSEEQEEVAFVTGLKTDLTSGGSIPGIEVDGEKITITNSNVLAEGDAKIENYNGNSYSFAFGEGITGASEATVTWKYTSSNGTLEFKSVLTAGFSITDAGKTIHNTSAGTADAKITNLKAGLEEEENGSIGGVVFEGGVFKIDNDVLNEKEVKLTQTKTSKETYKIALSDESTPEPAWTADKGTAKYVRTFKEGSYSTAADGKSIKYYKSATPVTVAEIKGLKTDITSGTVDSYVTANEDGTISISRDAFLSSKSIELKSDTYTKLVDANEGEEGSWGVKTDEPALKYASGKATVVTHSSEGWAYKTTTSKDVTTTDYKTLSYTKANDVTSATIGGLPTKAGKTAISYAAGEDGALYLADENGDATATKILEFTVPVEAEGGTEAQPGKIILYPGAFKNSPSKFTIGAKENYEFQFATGVDSEGNEIFDGEEAWDPAPKEVGAHWKTDGKGKAMIVAGTTAGYNFATSKTGTTDKKTVSAIKENYTTSATISGLPPYNGETETGIPADEYYDDDGESVLYGLQITKPPTDSESGVITISDESLLESLTKDSNGNTISSGKKLALGPKDKYTFEFGEDSIDEPEEENSVWVIDKKNGKATYQADVTAGYVISDGKSISYSNAVEGKKIVEVTGLDKDKLAKLFDFEESSNTTTVSKENFERYISVDGKTVTVNSSAFLSATTKLNDKSFSFAVGNSDDITKAGTSTDKLQWTLSGTTAKLYEGGGAAGYTVNSKGELVYQAATVSEDKLVATITGLKKGVKEADLDSIDVNEAAGSLKLGESVLGTTAVNLTSEKYKLSTKGVATSTSEEAYWDGSGSTAYWKQDIGEGYYTSNGGKTINYSTGSTNTLFTIKGLNKSVQKADLHDNVVVGDNNVVTIKNESVLNKAAVTLTGTGYTLDIGEDVATESKNVTEWSVSKGTATYKNYDKGYYSKSANGLSYTKDGKATTYATIKGLNTAATDADMEEHVHIGEDNVITIDDEVLVAAETATEKTTVTLTNGKDKAYTLALSEGQAVEYDPPVFGAVENKKSILTAAVSTAGYEIDSTRTKLTYMPTTIKKGSNEIYNTVTLATVSNVNNEGGLELEVDEESDGYTGYILVTKDALGDANLTLGKNDNYKFKLMDGETEVTSLIAGEIDEDAPTVKSGTYTLKGTTPNSYALKDDKTITATKGKSGAELAKITGLDKTLTDGSKISLEDGVFTISDGDLATVATGRHKTVGVKSAYGYEFDFAADFGDASITGDSTDDNIKVAGGGLIINTKKGNDTVDLGTAGGNTFFYASGDGDDVIANFSTTDIIKINEAGKDFGSKFTVEVAKDGDNAVVTMTKGKVIGKITLEGYSDSVSIVDKSGTAITPTSSGYWFDDNLGTSADLSGIVSNDFGAGLLGDLKTNKDYTSIAPQTVIYGVKK